MLFRLSRLQTYVFDHNTSSISLYASFVGIAIHNTMSTTIFDGTFPEVIRRSFFSCLGIMENSFNWLY